MNSYSRSEVVLVDSAASAFDLGGRFPAAESPSGYWDFGSP